MVITRRGKVVARLVSPLEDLTREESRVAAQRMRARLGGLAVKDLVSEGRLGAW